MRGRPPRAVTIHIGYGVGTALLPLAPMWAAGTADTLQVGTAQAMLVRSSFTRGSCTGHHIAAPLPCTVAAVRSATGDAGTLHVGSQADQEAMGVPGLAVEKAEVETWESPDYMNMREVQRRLRLQAEDDLLERLD